MKRDIGLDILLELSNTEYTEENGYWYKIEAWQVEPTPEIPHGIRYNLTLHNHYSKRILGFDNAHAISPRKKEKYKDGLSNMITCTKHRWIDEYIVSSKSINTLRLNCIVVED